jgi:uncharacterized membrane protein YgcG
MRLKITLFSLLLSLCNTASIFSDVTDSIGFFSPTAISSANEKIKDVKAKTGKDLVIETVESTNGEDPSNYAENKAKSMRVNGIYVLITKKEKKIEIKVGNKTRQVFGSSETANLKAKLVDEFKSKNFDSGLDKAVNYYSSTLMAVGPSGPRRNAQNSNYNNAPPVKTEGGGISIMTIIIIAIVGFILFRIVSSLLGGGGYSPGYGGGGFGGGGGGMGFMGSLMTGIFGAMAGNWLYDKFTGSDGGLFGGDHSSGSYGDSSGSDWSSQDDSYSSDSGSFDGGGDDFGGGGGDW